MENQKKVIVVIGASRGIGRATALALAEPGTHMVVAARDAVALDALVAELRARGADGTSAPCDATAEPHVRRLIETAAGITGRIDVLINSAGGAVVAPLADLTLADWERSLHVSLTSVFLTCKYTAARMRAGGLIVNVASVAARQAFPNWSAYVAAKHGLLGFSSAIREELRPHGIRVSVVLPAAVDTELWDAVPGEWNRANMLQPADVARAIAQLTTQPPYATTEELVIGHVAGRL